MDLIVAQLHVHYTEQPKWPLIGTVHIVVVFIINLVLHLRAEPGKFGYHSPNI